MISDKFTQVSTDQPITSGNTVSTDAIPLGAVMDPGAGSRVYMVFRVTTAFSGGTSLRCQAILGSNAGLTSSTIVVADTGVIPTASLTLGATFSLPLASIPRSLLTSTGRAFLGALYVPTGTFSAGKITAAIAVDPIDSGVIYQNGI